MMKKHHDTGNAIAQQKNPDHGRGGLLKKTGTVIAAALSIASIEVDEGADQSVPE